MIEKTSVIVHINSILELVASLLDMEASELRPEDNLFEMGFHSLMIIQLNQEIGERYGVKLSVNDMFIDPTAAGLASAISKAQAQN